MKVASWLAVSAIVGLVALMLLTTALETATLAFQARTGTGSTGSGLVPTSPGNPHGPGAPTPQPNRVKVNPKKCYNSCMKGGGGTWSDVQFCAYSCL